MDATRNPYAPGAGTRPPALTGRDPEFERVEILMKRLEAGLAAKSLLVTGLRGVGKTVLLNALAERALGRKWLAPVTELQSDTDLSRMIGRLVRKALYQMSLIERMKVRAARGLRILKAFSLSVGDVDLRVDVDGLTGFADSGDLQEDLGELLIDVGETAKEGGVGVAFLFDEMQLLGRGDLEALIAAFHKVSQRNLPLTLVGAGLPLLPKLAGEAKSYAERLFDFRKIGSLDDVAARDALVLPAERVGAMYENGAVSRILGYSERFPYFLQEYGKHVWNMAEKSPITVADVERAHPVVLAELDEGFFEVRLERTPTKERRYMVAMAALGNAPARTGEVSRALGYPTPGSASLIREGLLKKGLIYSPRYGYVEFTVPQFAEFMRRANKSELTELQEVIRQQRRRDRRSAIQADRRPGSFIERGST